jgi:hypothetical protein
MNSAFRHRTPSDFYHASLAYLAEISCWRVVGLNIFCMPGIFLYFHAPPFSFLICNYLYFEFSSNLNVMQWKTHIHVNVYIINLEFVSSSALYRATRFWHRSIRVEIRVSPILKDPSWIQRPSVVLLACRAAEDSDPSIYIGKMKIYA